MDAQGRFPSEQGTKLAWEQVGQGSGCVVRA